MKRSRGRSSNAGPFRRNQPIDLTILPMPLRSTPSTTPSFVDDVAPFRLALVNWFERVQRPLPWRTSPSLYRTVVSEFMLQQTRIETALPYFARWMQELPDFAALAAASEEEVVKLWEGLGYYRRARNLHRLARLMATLTEIPRSAEAWEEFPGIGAYTAAAITSIAFDYPKACVDGNVVRVLSRLVGYEKLLKDSASAGRFFQPLADTLVDPTHPGRHNQAMMELGATVCQRQPRCGECPVASFCEARRLGIAAELPRFPPREIEQVGVARVWRRRGNELLLARSHKTARRLADLCELPTAEEFGCAPAVLQEDGRLLLERKRSITRFQITERIYEPPFHLSPGDHPSLFWAGIESLDTYTFSGPHRRWIAELLQSSGPG
jgi:A/G-specific adenine glycosylase